MSSIFINGAQYAVSTVISPGGAISGITNAAPPVATTTTPPADDSVIVITSNWSAMDDAVARSANSTADTFEIKGFNTTNDKEFPAGEGAGSFSIASGFVSLTQIRDIQMSGGEQNFYDFQYVEDRNGRQRKKPTFKNAITFTIPMDYDAAKPWYPALVELDRLGKPVVLRSSMPDGAEVLYYGYLSFNKVPTGSVNENLQVTATFSLLSEPTRYEAE